MKRFVTLLGVVALLTVMTGCEKTIHEAHAGAAVSGAR